MIRLVRSEFRRIAARRLLRVTLALTALGIVGGGVLAFATSSSLSESAYRERVQVAHAQQEAQRASVEACLGRHGIELSSKGQEVPDAIARACYPDNNIRAHDPRFHRVRLAGVLRGTTGVLAIVAWALGASLVGAEFASRSMTTLLTWETRRGRVFLAKIVAVMVAVAAFAAVTLLLIAVAMLPALAARGAALRANDPSWASVFGIIGRGIVLAPLAAGMGFAIAAVGRNTAAALGAGFAYVVVLENILGNSIAGWRRWLLLGNVIVFVTGHNNGADVPGRSVTGAAIFLTAIAVTLLVAAATTFRARDIA